MLLLCLLSIFTVGNGDLICMYNKISTCYLPFIERRDDEYCSGAPQTIDCLKETSAVCDVEDAREVTDMKTRVREVCREGTELNKLYVKHKTCVFHLARQEASGPCMDDVTTALDNYTATGNSEDDGIARFKLYCRYDDRVNMCLEEKVSDNCGAEAEKFHRKFFAPANDLILRACIENGTSTCNLGLTLILQAVAVVFLKVFSINMLGS